MEPRERFPVSRTGFSPTPANRPSVFPNQTFSKERFFPTRIAESKGGVLELYSLQNFLKHLYKSWEHQVKRNTHKTDKTKINVGEELDDGARMPGPFITSQSTWRAFWVLGAGWSGVSWPGILVLILKLYQQVICRCPCWHLMKHIFPSTKVGTLVYL